MQAVEEDGLPGFLIGIYLMNLAQSNAMHCCILDTHSKELCFVSQAIIFSLKIKVSSQDHHK